MKRAMLIGFFVLAASTCFSQAYFKQYSHPFRLSTRAGLSFIERNIPIWDSHDAVRVTVLVDSLGVAYHDSVKIAYNMDTTVTHTVPLRSSMMSGVPFDLYDEPALSGVYSIQIWGNVRWPLTVIVH